MSTALLAITAGEPAGIGPDLCVRIAQVPHNTRLVLLTDRRVLEERATSLNLHLDLPDYRPGLLAPVSVLHLPTAVPVVPGRLQPANAFHVLNCLRRAVAGCQSGEFTGLVTGPAHKGIINDAGVAFTGHTEFLAELCGCKRVVMMLAGGELRVALATTHLPVREIADAITVEALEETLRILHAALRRDFGLDQPRILVAGLNPHAGEGGHLGREEIDIIQPVIRRLRAEGMTLSDPLPADTLFQPKYLEHADAVLAMYHDQGLPVLKHDSFGTGVNITLGLPIIRTSVDHGTALDLAATGQVDAGSMQVAIATAREMARHRARFTA
jgi:4-hydroxythreonine-4-phosphate dehydrogenase